MTKHEIDGLLEKYAQWLKDNTFANQVGKDWVEITTPHLDRHNDCMQIYVRKTDGGYLLTDGGNIISDLANSGCPIDTPRRKGVLLSTLSGLGVELVDDELRVNATHGDFPLKKNNILQAMLAVNDLFYLSSPHAENFFKEDVAGWFDLSEIRYTPKVTFVGKAGFTHLFDFVIPKSRSMGERVVHTMSNPQRDYAQNMAFRWVDTKEIRETDSSFYVLLNDSTGDVPGKIIDALRNYDIKPIMWSKREEAKGELAA